MYTVDHVPTFDPGELSPNDLLSMELDVSSGRGLSLLGQQALINHIKRQDDELGDLRERVERWGLDYDRREKTARDASYDAGYAAGFSDAEGHFD